MQAQLADLLGLDVILKAYQARSDSYRFPEDLQNLGINDEI